MEIKNFLCNAVSATAVNNTTSNRKNFTDRQMQPVINHVNTTANNTITVTTVDGNFKAKSAIIVPAPVPITDVTAITHAIAAGRDHSDYTHKVLFT